MPLTPDQWKLLGALCIGVAGGLLVVLISRVRRASEPPARTPRTDLTNMMILFQTMRDILEQQKDLARRFNKHIDRRMAEIRQLVDGAQADMNLMQQSARRLNASMEELKAEVAALKARENIGGAQDQGPNGAPPLEAQLTGEATGDEAGEDTTRRPASGRWHVVAGDRPSGASPSESWVGLDFAGQQPQGYGFEVPEEAPEHPEEPEASREAFRTLLNMESQARRPAAGSPSAASEGSGASATPNGPSTPIQSRVYEYSDAGMTVAEIARELGVGKGEVRLILSLRKTKGA